MMWKTLCILCAAALSWTLMAAPPKNIAQPNETVVYKKAPDGEELKLFVFYPPGYQKTDAPRPLMLMYHGGGWRGGAPTQFFNQCRDYADRGYVAISASYRLSPKEKPQNTVFHAVEDARSAIRYIKKNAARFGIDPKRIITAGSSAGAHLAIATSVLKLDAADDDLSIDPSPAAVILMCPVVDAGPPPGYRHIYKRIPDRYKEFSPIHNLHEKMPPQLILLGDKDSVLSVKHAEEYKKQVEEKGCRCDLVIFPGAKHAAFYQGKYYADSQPSVEKFLRDLKLTPEAQQD